MSQYRHEWKHEISPSGVMALRQRLSAVAQVDSHADEGRYVIRSLYFDNLRDKALWEKLDGVNRREKFRIRYYNGDTSTLRLEKKSKLNGLCAKETAPLREEEVREVLSGRFSPEDPPPLVEEFCRKCRHQGLRPRTIVEYTREPFVFAPGNVRVTLDYGLRTAPSPREFLTWESAAFPAWGAPAILEVKWDEFLPDLIRDAVQLPECRTSSFSKYAVCREAFF